MLVVIAAVVCMLPMSGPVFTAATSSGSEPFLMQGQVDYNNSAVNKQTAAFTGPQGADFGRVKDPREAVMSMIQSFLVLLGTLFMVYTVYAGYLILTSAGNEERVEKGKHILRNTTIGLFIILSAYGTTWIVKRVFVATGDDAYRYCDPPADRDFINDPLSPQNLNDPYTNC